MNEMEVNGPGYRSPVADFPVWLQTPSSLPLPPPDADPSPAAVRPSPHFVEISSVLCSLPSGDE